ncbi:DNA alkylation repair protein [Undibacterium baiyunense]|uniref:DNA alkylation repair protein n=1 Tax=Undibacterium baiyunense TaxID=2828731 RepID=A0A941DC27_9BURK|nr:DNA alkylation repair protein [Undibacterium baiyunense]MBR7745963.1 DNA alkylation repair protein [Undibacterium baiyunense]
MLVQEFVHEVQRCLQANANSEHAPAMRAYMRDQFDFLGIKTPLRRQLLAQIVKSMGKSKFSATEVLQLADLLWEMPQREYQYIAIDLLAQHKKVLGLQDISALIQLAQKKAWWDSVDGLAAVIGDIVFLSRANSPDAQACMDQALQHASMWVRRIAITHQLGWRLQTDTTRLFSYALQLAAEEDFFIRKAIGWALRDYARWQPARVRDFVSAYQMQLSSLSVREALKHL